MRARMERERPAKSHWDLKLAPGGLVDVEFIAQALQIAAAQRAPEVLSSNTGEALARLAAAGIVCAEESANLIEAWALYSDLQQGLRICVEGAFEPEHATEILTARLAALGHATDFPALEVKLVAAQTYVRAAFVRLVGAVV